MWHVHGLRITDNSSWTTKVRFLKGNTVSTASMYTPDQDSIQSSEQEVTSFSVKNKLLTGGNGDSMKQ
jgi:hypothetical protein